MPFDADKFERSEFAPRTTRVPVHSLAAFFAEGEPPEWEVRGLSAVELHKALEAGRKQGNFDAIVKALAQNQDQVAALRKALGLTKDTPGDIAKRLEMLVMGSVAPVVTLPQAAKLAEAFPVEFMTLTNEITELTGKGFDLVKPKAASRKTKA